MPIPAHVLINLGIFFGVFAVLSFILSIGAARGFKFHSCKGDDGNCCKGHGTADKIMALIEKECQNKAKEL
ncbi:MAG: hypothetical protein ACRCS8_05595 [Brevinema sp.]